MFVEVSVERFEGVELHSGTRERPLQLLVLDKQPTNQSQLLSASRRDVSAELTRIPLTLLTYTEVGLSL